MSQIRISSPTSAAAFVLTDLLGERGVTASVGAQTHSLAAESPAAPAVT